MDKQIAAVLSGDTVLGLAWYSGPAQGAVAAARGLCVWPAAPGLATLDTDIRYRQALVGADVRYVDSGFLALAWWLLSGRALVRVSGLRFLRDWLASGVLGRHRSLWVHPSAIHLRRNREYLERLPHANPTLLSHYVAPLYPDKGDICDNALLQTCRHLRPQYIVINLGGGIQEPLGAYLRDALAKDGDRPTIICTGGALDFLTGAQARIPIWADRLFLGWLWRAVATPRAQAKNMRTHPAWRYLGAWRLWGLLVKYRGRLPIA